MEHDDTEVIGRAIQQGALGRLIADGTLQGEWAVHRASDGRWTGCVILRAHDGRELGKACVEVLEGDIIEGMHRLTGGAASGFSIRSLARRIARGRLLRKMVAGANNILKNKWVARAVGVAAVIVPGYGQALGAAYLAARGATTAIRRAQEGDARARQGLEQIAAQAAQGNPTAREAMGVLQAVAPTMGAAQAALSH